MLGQTAACFVDPEGRRKAAPARQLADLSIFFSRRPLIQGKLSIGPGEWKCPLRVTHYILHARDGLVVLRAPQQYAPG
jgi:hypothetical protein